MKLCGCEEECFTNGEEQWGHMGSIMCENLSETIENFGYCSEYKDIVDCYFDQEDFENKSVVKVIENK